MIQEFCPRQLDDVMRLWLEGNLQAHPFVPASYWRQNADAVRAAIPQARVWVWVEQDGAVGGFLGLQDGYIAGLFMERRLQGRGVGTRLLRHVQSLSDNSRLPHKYTTAVRVSSPCFRFLCRRFGLIQRRKISCLCVVV